MRLKQYRTELNITATEAAQATSVPFRTYLRYENDDNYGNKLKREAILNILKEKYEVTEERGILSLDFIKAKCKEIFDKYDDQIEYCYLFGSYAKGKATGKSDIDLMITGEVEGLEYYELLGVLEERLHKKVDLIRIQAALQNVRLINEILKDGVKIYG